MDRCLATVGIVTYNRAVLLPKAIESALTQDCAGIHISVIDDGSSDDTSGIASRFPAVEWITLPQSRGYLEARNHWIAHSGAAYFVGLDDDASFTRGDEIRLALACMEADSSIGAVAFDILSPDQSQPRARTGTVPVSCFIGCGHALRLSAVRKVGGYEPLPGRYGVEEKDLCLRLMDAGYEIVRLNGVHVWHEKTMEARQIPVQHRSGVCNDLVMTVRRTPAYALPLALAAKLYRHFVFAFRNNLLRPAFAGFALFFKSFDATWRTRKPVKLATLRAFMKLRT